MSLPTDTFVPYLPEPSQRSTPSAYRGGVGEELEIHPNEPPIDEGGIAYLAPPLGGAYNTAFVGVKARGPNYIPLDYLDDIAVEEEERKVGDSGDEGNMERKKSFRRLNIGEGEFDSRSQNSHVSVTPKNDETSPSGTSQPSPLDSSLPRGVFWTSSLSTSSSSTSSSAPFPTPNPKLERGTTEPGGPSQGASWVQKYKFDYKEREAITTSLSSGTDNYYWNRQFQRILDLPEDTSRSTNYKYRLLAQLAVDFVDTAQTYGKVIISELLLPDHRKSITPDRSLPGVAGGVKFIVRGILFKLAQDEPIPEMREENRYVYGGSEGPNDECAAKGAGHDLKGKNAYLKYSLQIRKYSASGPFFRLPMEALIDYRGHRLSAMSLVPVGKLVYGSSDGGRVVHDTDEFSFMKNAAEYLHLAEHLVRGKHLWCAGDIELHEAGNADGDLRRFYLIDLARAMPPEFRQYCSHLRPVGHTEFYRLFRPEYLQIRKKNGLPPLSPDGLTGWSASSIDSREHSKRIAQATHYLLRTIIPEFAAEIDRTAIEISPPIPEKDLKLSRRDSGVEITGPIPGDPLNSAASSPVRAVLSLPVSEQVHRRGINIRHIGLLRSLVTKNAAARRTLFVELVGRTLKNMLRAWLREAIKNWPQGLEPSESYFRWSASCFCNLVSGSHSQSRSFWKEVYAGLVLRFGEISLNEEEKSDLFAAAKPDLFQIIKHVLNMTHIHLSSLCQKHLSADNGQETYGFYFTPSDIESMAVRVKHMPLLDYAKAKLLLNEAFGSDLSLRASGRLLELSIAFLKDVLRSDTMNISAEQDQCLARCLTYEHSQQFEEADTEILLAATLICARLNQRGVDEDDNDGEFAKIVEVGIYLLQAQQGIWKRRTSTRILTKLAEVMGKDLPNDLPEIKGGRFQNFGGASSLRILRWHGDCLSRLKPQLTGASMELLRYYDEISTSRQHSINAALQHLALTWKKKQEVNQHAIGNGKMISPVPKATPRVDDWLNRSPVPPSRHLGKQPAFRSLDVNTPESPSTSGSSQSPSPLTFPDRPPTSVSTAPPVSRAQTDSIPTATSTPATPVVDRPHSYDGGGRGASSLLPSSASMGPSPSTPLTKNITFLDFLDELDKDQRGLPKHPIGFRRRSAQKPPTNNSYWAPADRHHRTSNSVGGGTPKNNSKSSSGADHDEPPSIQIPQVRTTPSPSSTLSDSDQGGQAPSLGPFSAPSTPLLRLTSTRSQTPSIGLRDRKSQTMRFAREPTFTLAPPVSPPSPFRMDIALNVFSPSEFILIPEIHRNTLIDYARFRPEQRHSLFKTAIDPPVRQGDLVGIQILVEIEAACAACFAENPSTSASEHESIEIDPPSPSPFPGQKGLFDLGPGAPLKGGGDGEQKVTRSRKVGGNGVGEEFLGQSIRQKATSKVICLLSAGVDPRSTDVGNPLLHFAVDAPSLPIMKILVEAKAQINALNSHGETPLLEAVFRQRSTEMVQYLIHAKANVNAVDTKSQNGLFSSSISDKKREKAGWSSALCTLLLQSKIDPNQKNLDGMTPLHYWIQSVSPHRVEAVRLLCKYADVNMPNQNGVTPMTALCETSYPPQAEKLKEAQNQNLSILQCLIATGGIDLNARDHNSLSPIVRLLTGGQEEEKRPLTDCLLQAKCDLNARYTNDATLLMLVAKRPLNAPLKLLLQHDVDLNAQDTHGLCALHHAVTEGNHEIVKLLVEANASVNLKDKKGQLPVDIAENLSKKENKKKQKFAKCIRYLQDPQPKKSKPKPAPKTKPAAKPKPVPWPLSSNKESKQDGGGGGSSGGGGINTPSKRKSVSLNREKEKENGGVGRDSISASSSRGSGGVIQSILKGVFQTKGGS